MCIFRLHGLQGAFKDYRAALHKAKPPSLPYLGMYLTDLTFIDDGNPDTVDGKINWNKRELTYRVLSEIELYQQVPYNFPPVEPIRTFLTELPGINEKVQFVCVASAVMLMRLSRSSLSCRCYENRAKLQASRTAM